MENLTGKTALVTERLPLATLIKSNPEDGSFCRWARTRHNGSRWSTKGRMDRPVFGN